MPDPIPPPAPTLEQLEQLRIALIHKAARLYVTVPGGMGGGDFTEYTPASLRPDYAIEELLFGMRGPARLWDWTTLDLTTLATVENVIVIGLEGQANSTAYDRDEIESALLAACAWLKSRLTGWGMAF